LLETESWEQVILPVLLSRLQGRTPFVRSVPPKRFGAERLSKNDIRRRGPIRRAACIKADGCFLYRECQSGLERSDI